MGLSLGARRRATPRARRHQLRHEQQHAREPRGSPWNESSLRARLASASPNDSRGEESRKAGDERDQQRRPARGEQGAADGGGMTASAATRLPTVTAATTSTVTMLTAPAQRSRRRSRPRSRPGRRRRARPAAARVPRCRPARRVGCRTGSWWSPVPDRGRAVARASSRTAAMGARHQRAGGRGRLRRRVPLRPHDEHAVNACADFLVDQPRDSSLFAAVVDVPGIAPAIDVLVGLTGRDPAWRPPS